MTSRLRRPTPWLLLTLALGGAGACSTTTNTTTNTTTTTTTSSANASDDGVAAQRGTRAPFSLEVLLTTDEHGWLNPLLDKKASVLRGGVHAAAAAMKAEGYTSQAPGWLLLSAGDMWTGPYETTVLEGAPMVAVMSHLGYRAAAVGNHEFDFGQRVISERARAARFPFLAANLVETNSGRLPAWVTPYNVVTVDVPGGSARVAVVGLACVESPVTADVRNMVGLSFLPYDETLKEWLPKVWQVEKPDAVVVVAHDSIAAVESLTPLLRQHNVHLLAAGHEHRPGIVVDDNGSEAVDDDVVICNAGPYLRTFCRVDLAFGGDGGLTAHAEKLVEVTRAADAPAPPFDPELDEILTNAEASAARIGGEVLIHSDQRLTRGREGTLGQLIVDAWLEALPYAQVAITNAGGLRQDIEAGPLRIRDIVSALPFNNYLLVVDVTGAELKDLLANPQTVVGGVTFDYTEDEGGSRLITSVLDVNGAPIPDDRQIKVVINDFMYRGGDHYRFSDTEPEETAVDWREPVFRMLRSNHGAGGRLNRSYQPRSRRN